MDRQPLHVSSPNSTGGGGTHFEQHVGAAFLAWLLMRAIPPILTDCTLAEVHFQTERLNWKTDDILLIGENGLGEKRKLVCQVKQSITVSASDPEFSKLMTDAWHDFKNGELFDRSKDRFAIITLRGTEVLLRHFGGLLDCARTSRSSEEFANRLSTKGLVHSKAVSHFHEVAKIIESRDARRGDQTEIWAFLRLLHVLSLDLNTTTRQSEAQIKSLLAYTASDAPLAAADATWNELLREVGEGKPEAKAYRRDDFSPELRARHSPVATREQNLLSRLREHSKLILDGIRTTIGLRIELDRRNVVQSVLERLQESSIVLISGSAGSGKSGIAKRVLDLASKDYFTFAFRAEEFAVAHLDQTLNAAQVGLNGVTLGAILSAQPIKLLLVESIERLLEATTRDAFADLLSLIAHDASWRVIMTCRDYSADLVRSSLLQFATSNHTCVSISPLDELELNQVAVACPEVAQPLANIRLRRLLSNPYMLDKATQMPWPLDHSLPENEIAFRAKFWAEVIRANSHMADGMPRRRQEVFVEIALRRAKSLAPYVPRDGMDDVAVDKLTSDSLIMTSTRTDKLIAPAHDVLEDWAILQWIDEQHALAGDDLLKLSEALGGFPAIRRGFRKWLGELVERVPESADALFTEALIQESVSAQFRDDTLVSLLCSGCAQDFIRRHVDVLFGNDKVLLKRMIHLLRVGCVAIPPWFEGGMGTDLEIQVPAGESWQCILQLISDRLSCFASEESGLLLGLVKGMARGVSWRTPYPTGSEATIAISYWLLAQFEGYREEENRREVLSIIASLPKCDEVRFRLLLGEVNGVMSQDVKGIEEEFRELILSGIEGNAACRDFPHEVIAVTKATLLMTDEEFRNSRGFGYSSELVVGFGFQPTVEFDDFPASAYQGPYFFLLRHHLKLGMNFIIEVANHSAEWYGSERIRIQHVEPPAKIQLDFGDQTFQEQWANSRLWNLYRGTAVGPDPLQSALMALERRLIEVAVTDVELLDGLLGTLLRSSKSAALTAIAASLATAFPHACPETLLTLLRSRDCIQLDRQRMADESRCPVMLNEAMSSSDHKLHDRERREAARWEHRSRDLEAAILNLQLGEHAATAQAIIDRHVEAVPPSESRTEDDRIWLLALRRMDLRGYRTGEIVEVPKSDSAADGSKMLRLEMELQDSDIQAMSDEAALQQAEIEQQVGSQMWGVKVFEGAGGHPYDPREWKSRLQQAQKIRTKSQAMRFARSGPEFVAAICVRDHFAELSSQESCWCVEKVCEAIEQTANMWNELDRIQINSMRGDRPCAWVVSSLVDRPMTDSLRTRVRNAFVLALTHPNCEVRSCASNGAGRHLCADNYNLARRCVSALAFEADLVQSVWKKEQKRPFAEQMQLAEIEFHAAAQIRKHFFSEALGDAYGSLELSDWIGSDANHRILLILKYAESHPESVAAFCRTAAVLVQWWDDQDRGEHRHKKRRDHSSKTELALTFQVNDFVLRVNLESASEILKPILDAIDRHPREVASTIEGIVASEDASSSNGRLWPVWQLFADRIKMASWLARIEDRHSAGHEVLRAIFLASYWPRGIRHWQGLDGAAQGEHAHRLHSLFGELPPCSFVVDNYVRFLYHIGETCLPMAFCRVAERLRSGSAPDMLRMSNTVFMLESLLRRYIYGRPIELKSVATLKESVLYLLDVLVECGSSSAYRMRDDFVTPLSTTTKQ
ncbi:MAG: hypothetical protein JWP89_366 [Schlesneria sp.]|nr:hypothetical protein [Schlesneria sp.]